MLCPACTAAGAAPALGTSTDPGLAPTLAGIRRVPPGDLTAILAGAQPGTELRLAAGRYMLSEPVRLAHGLRLVGAGAEQTVIVGVAGARLHVHPLEANETITMEGLTLTQTASEAGRAELLRVTAGHLTLRDCRLEGGLGALWVGGRARVEATGCGFIGSAGCGLQAMESAVVKLVDCIVSGHAGFGVRVGDRAQLDATALTARSNGRGGVAVGAWGRLSLVGGAIAENGRRGVLIRSAAPCRVADCAITHNAGPGVEVGRTPSLALERNQIRANQGAGVMLGDGARAEASANALEENAEDGFAVYQGASARLVGNGANRNGRFGVWVGSGGEAALADNAAGDNQGGEYMAAWTAAIAPEAAAWFGRRSDQSSRAAREHLRPGGRFGRR
jgi:hypothetical protein